MLRVQDERNLNGVNPLFAGLTRMQQVEKMRRQRLTVCVNRDALAVSREVVPVEKHRPHRSQQGIGDLARPGDVVALGLGPQTTQHGDAGAKTSIG